MAAKRDDFFIFKTEIGRKHFEFLESLSQREFEDEFKREWDEFRKLALAPKIESCDRIPRNSSSSLTF